MKSQAPVTLRSFAPTPSPEATKKQGGAELWFDASLLGEDAASLLPRLGRSGYTGILLKANDLATLVPQVGPQLLPIVAVEGEAELLLVPQHGVVASADERILSQARGAGFPTCLRAYVDDGDSLHDAIDRGQKHDYLILRFKDPTNIPLELVIATLQPTNTVLIKEISTSEDVDDAVVTLGVMEVGAEGVMFSPKNHAVLDDFLGRLAARGEAHIALKPATIVRSVPVGMGYRSCIDLATLFTPREGMLVGSTSQGGILCCPEVFFLPYMELRPFRVNAGAVHSYVYNFADRTDYMSELRAGASVMIVDLDGKARRAAVGRIKTEVRPLRLIEARFDTGEMINVLMQDDWHVRIFSAKGEPLNVTELKAGDEVMAYPARPGRHVGIKVEETILES